MLDINSVDLDQETVDSIIDLYYHNYKTTIRISKMLDVPLPVVKTVVRYHGRVLALKTTPEATVPKGRILDSKSKPKSSSRTVSTVSTKDDRADTLSAHLAERLQKARAKDKIKCPILQYV